MVLGKQYGNSLQQVLYITACNQKLSINENES